MLDLSELDLESVFAQVERALEVEIDRSADKAFGWGGKSIGMKARSRDGDEQVWIRICSRPADAINERTWTGEECAGPLLDVAKPQLLRSFRWGDSSRHVVWRADE